MPDEQHLPADRSDDHRPPGAPGGPTPPWRSPARFGGAGLLATTAAIHLYLYLDGYRTIPVIGWLFLLQVVTGLALAAAVLATAGRVAAALGGAFAVSTLGGYLLSIWFGLFGFKEVFTIAGLFAGVLEVTAFAVLGALALLPAGSAFGPRRRVQTLAAASLVALALLAGALTSAGTAAAVKAPGGVVTLRTRRIAGTPVLTDAQGFTLYWFALDSPRASHCYGTCTTYWPPAIGRPARGPGVTGTLGTLERRGGSLQATYDHHPLYTYIGDSAPGQANGNGILLDGGRWHEMVVSSG